MTISYDPRFIFVFYNDSENSAANRHHKLVRPCLFSATWYQKVCDSNKKRCWKSVPIFWLQKLSPVFNRVHLPHKVAWWRALTSQYSTSVFCGAIASMCVDLVNSAFHPSWVGKWVVIHVVTWITGVETTKRQTRAAYHCFVAGQSQWVRA